MYVCLAIGFGLNPDEDCQTVAGTGIAGTSDGPNEVASFTEIYGGSVWWYNDLYVAQKNCIRVVSSDYTRTLSGSCTSMSDADGDYSVARFGYLYGIAADDYYLYVTDTTNKKIKKVSISGTSTTVMSFDEYIYDISISGDTMYVTTKYQILTCSMVDWICEALAGIEDTLGYQDGNNSEALFNNMRGITHIWNSTVVSGRENYCLRQIDGGRTSTLYGNCTYRGSNSGGDDYLYRPARLTPTTYDTLLVSDMYTIREVDANGFGVTVAKFPEFGFDVQEVGDYLYVILFSRILKCSWESMATSSSSSMKGEDDVVEKYFLMMWISLVLLILCTFGVLVYCVCLITKHTRKNFNATFAEGL